MPGCRTANMAVVSATTAADYAQPRQFFCQSRIGTLQTHRITIIQFRRLIQFGVALPRCIGAKQPDTIRPRLGQHIGKMGGSGAVEGVDRHPRCRSINGGNRSVQRIATGQTTVGFHGEGNCHRHSLGCCGAGDAYRLARMT